MLRKGFAFAALGLLLVAGPALAAGTEAEVRDVHWSFEGPFGKFDKGQLQRGYKVYREVCSACHSMNLLYFRNLGQKGGPFYEEKYPNPNDNPFVKSLAKDAQVNGCTFKEGQMVLLSFPAANRDPAMFPDADKVIIDRKENRHAAFGLGIHRCVGSNLARMEMTVAIEEWLKRIPDFRLDPAGKVTWSEGTVRGPRQLPMLFGRPA